MGRRKTFIRTELSTPEDERALATERKTIIPSESIPPKNTIVNFKRNAIGSRSFDFTPWYGVKIDTITYACQRQIERFLAGQDNIISTSTISAYCHTGLRSFLEYCSLRAKAIRRKLTPSDIDRNLIDGYLHYLKKLAITTTSQKEYYAKAKAVLRALGLRRVFPLISTGDNATFPKNPFPNNSRKYKSATALSKRERKDFTKALQEAIGPIWMVDTSITANLLSFALLAIALHTGRNTTPLLEMDRNCLHPHPKENTAFLVLWKRRGHTHSRVALRVKANTKLRLESMFSVKNSVENLIRRVMALTEPLDSEAPDEYKGRVWLYRSRANASTGQVTALTSMALHKSIGLLVKNYSLKDSNGKPLRINISRLRKTFANRIFELSNGDLLITAAALGNTPRVTDQNYLAPGEDSRRNWQFMGGILVNELLTATIGATYKETPTGRCADPVNGQYAPKREGATCMNFMSCLRCKHYAVTSQDLYKLFSFYFRVLAERSRMDKRRWARDYSHIPRLIDDYIVAEGLRRKIFKASMIDATREHARSQPHPFWSVDLVGSLEIFS
ncbi:hypothetical protein N5D79_11750 [Pseudomonas sp. GD03817]|uniref:hypothetical protein n=1 Tax=unclassified Pseudomonas TaxID=196821 RepID=UPI0024486FE7|nr:MULTISPECIES: hypothetical protein [unclassified Pseudomonas]MDH1402493.1 hypothetical protein [Pseudomonas sp. GD03730]MDH1775552.1 hypothetical protein [Pseudomonas sp. GD03817]